MRWLALGAAALPLGGCVGLFFGDGFMGAEFERQADGHRAFCIVDYGGGLLSGQRGLAEQAYAQCVMSCLEHGYTQTSGPPINGAGADRGKRLSKFTGAVTSSCEAAHLGAG